MRTYIVLGMHRSGTSFISKALAEQGVNMGNDLGKADWGNPHGYWENQDFIELNTKILKHVKGEWDIVPSKKKIRQSAEHHKEEVKELVHKYKDDLWGWKDPRTSITLPAYLPHLEDIEDNDIYLVCMFRKPNKVAQSNEKVGNRSAERAEEITRDYNRRIFENVKEFLGYE